MSQTSGNRSNKITSPGWLTESLWESYCQQLQSQIEQLKICQKELTNSLTATESLKTISALSHKIHGSAGSFKMHEISSVAAEIEKTCNQLTQHTPILESITSNKSIKLISQRLNYLFQLTKATGFEEYRLRLFKPKFDDKNICNQKFDNKNNNNIRAAMEFGAEPLQGEIDAHHQHTILLVGTSLEESAITSIQTVKEVPIHYEIIADLSSISIMDGNSIANYALCIIHIDDLESADALSSDRPLLVASDRFMDIDIPPIWCVSDDDSWRSRKIARQLGAQRFVPGATSHQKLIHYLLSDLQLTESRAIKVLYIEDDIALANYHQAFLQTKGCEVTLAHCAEEALPILASHRPDIIITDLHLPDLNGDEFARVIGLNDKYADIPITFLSADQNWDVQLELLRSGHDFLSKPVSQRKLWSTIQRYANIERRQHQHRLYIKNTHCLTEFAFIELFSKRLSSSQRNQIPNSIYLLNFDISSLTNSYLPLPERKIITQSMLNIFEDDLRSNDMLCQLRNGLLVLSPSPDRAVQTENPINRIKIQFERLAVSIDDQLVHPELKVKHLLFDTPDKFQSWLQYNSTTSIFNPINWEPLY